VTADVARASRDARALPAWLWATSTVGLAAGCLVGPVDGVPCVVDEHCATDAFCDLPAAMCAPGTAPDLQVAGIVDDGAIVIDPFVAPDATTALGMRIENRGGAPAVDVALRMATLACLGLVVDEGTVPTTVPPGGVVDVAFRVTPRLCASPVIQDWFLSFSGRGARGTFNVVVERAPPSGD
jgi:hypothetical protein